MQKQDVIFSNKHPKEMYLLALTEMCQRFAYWGVGNLLVLFLVKHFLYSPARAAHLFGLYTGVAFIFPVLGGYIADKWNYTKPVFLGSLLVTCGSLLLSTLQEFLILPGLAFIAFGGGLFTPSIYSLLGKLYTKNHPLREGGFSIYYALVNLGIFAAMISLGYLQTINWRYVFLLSAAIPLLGLIPYFFALKTLQKIPIPSHYFVSKKDDPNNYPLKKHEKDRIIVILIMIFVSIVFWMAYNQAGSSLTLFAYKFTDRNVFNFEIPTPWLISAEAFFLILLAFPLAALYLFLRRIKSSASPPMKTALSLFFMGLCFIVMERAASHIQQGATDATKSPFYLIFAFILMALAELFLAPVGLSLVTNLSPHRYRGLLTGIWFTCIGIGFYLGGYLASLMNTVALSQFFDIFVITSFVPAFILILFAKKLDHMRHIKYL